MNKTKAKNRLSLFLSYFLSLLLTLLMCSAVVGMTVCNSSFCKTQILKSGFSQVVCTELKENYESYGAAGGFDKQVMTSFISEGQIQTDMFAAVDSLYRGERELLQHPEIKDAALKTFETDLEKRNITVTENIKEGLNQLADGCRLDYESYVSVMMSGYIAPLVPKVTRLAIASIAFFSVASIFTVLLLFKTERDWEKRISDIVYALIATAAFCFLLVLAGKMFFPIERINVSPKSAYVFLVQYVASVFQAVLYFGIINTILAAALIITIKTKRFQKYYSQRNF